MRNSGNDTTNAKVADWSKDYAGGDNLAFFTEAFKKYPGDGPAIGLIGSRDLPGVSLRRAQAVLRWDLSPSLWSHAMLIFPGSPTAAGGAGGAVVREVALYDRAGHFPEPEDNGVNDTTLRYFAGAAQDANVAFLRIPMDAKEGAAVSARALDVNFDRVRHNFWDLLGVWQTYFWSFGQRPNPLREGFPFFSSQYVEMVFEAIGIDITPGASERNSAPEHIWNTARWWQKPFQEMYGRSIEGCYVLRDKGCALMNWEDRHAAHKEATAKPTKPRGKKR